MQLEEFATLPTGDLSVSRGETYSSMSCRFHPVLACQKADLVLVAVNYQNPLSLPPHRALF